MIQTITYLPTYLVSNSRSALGSTQVGIFLEEKKKNIKRKCTCNNDRSKIDPEKNYKLADTHNNLLIYYKYYTGPK